MKHPMKHTTHASTSALGAWTWLSLAALAALLAACHDAPQPVSPPEASPEDAVLAGGRPAQQILPTGKGVGTRTSMRKGQRTRYPIEYHNGPVMRGGANVYLIWYGTWEGSSTPPIVVDFTANVGATPYMTINTLYRDSNGGQPSSVVTYGGSADDAYSSGAALTEADLVAVVRRAIDNLLLPEDPSGIYFVLGSSDVTVSNGTSLSCTNYCGLHNTATTTAGSQIQYAFVGSAARCPAQCAAQTVGPNGTLEADAMVNIMANLISTAVTDPTLSAWYDRLGLENADKCAWDFGPTYTAPNGARANIQLGARHYLLQRNWVPTSKGGYCALAAPPA